MTLDQYIFKDSQDSKEQSNSSKFCKVIKIINKLLDMLDEFEGNFDKKFNMSKLANFWNLSESEVRGITSLILNFQEKFETVFKNHRLINKNINKKTYFVLEPKEKKKTDQNIIIPNKIKMQKTQLDLFSDIIYYFKRVKKGKGFDISSNETALIRNLKNLMGEHPYLFLKNGGNLIYPSELGLEAGNYIFTYKKSNKTITSFEIKNHKFEVV